MSHLSATHHVFFFFFNDTATTEIYTLSLHDALPIYSRSSDAWSGRSRSARRCCAGLVAVKIPTPHGGACATAAQDRKSTRLNSSHQIISYAVFCLKKKKKDYWQHTYMVYTALKLFVR